MANKRVLGTLDLAFVVNVSQISYVAEKGREVFTEKTYVSYTDRE